MWCALKGRREREGGKEGVDEETKCSSKVLYFSRIRALWCFLYGFVLAFEGQLRVKNGHSNV